MASATGPAAAGYSSGCRFVYGLFQFAGRLVIACIEAVIDDRYPRPSLHPAGRYLPTRDTSGCPGPLRWYAVDRLGLDLAPHQSAAILECAACGYFVMADAVPDFNHGDTPIGEPLQHDGLLP